MYCIYIHYAKYSYSNRLWISVHLKFLRKLIFQQEIIFSSKFLANSVLKANFLSAFLLTDNILLRFDCPLCRFWNLFIFIALFHHSNFLRVFLKYSILISNLMNLAITDEQEWQNILLTGLNILYLNLAVTLVQSISSYRTWNIANDSYNINKGCLKFLTSFKGDTDTSTSCRLEYHVYISSEI